MDLVPFWVQFHDYRTKGNSLNNSQKRIDYIEQNLSL